MYFWRAGQFDLGGRTGSVRITAEQDCAMFMGLDPNLIALEMKLGALAGKGIPSRLCGTVKNDGLE